MLPRSPVGRLVCLSALLSSLLAFHVASVRAKPKAPTANDEYKLWADGCDRAQGES